MQGSSSKDLVNSCDSIADGSSLDSPSPEATKLRRPFIDIADTSGSPRSRGEITFVTISGDHPQGGAERHPRLATLHPARSTDSEASSTSTHLRPASSLDKDSDDASLHVTEDEDSGSHEGTRERHRRWLKDSSVETEDEGLGGLDMESNYKEYTTPISGVVTVTHNRPAIPLVTYKAPGAFDMPPTRSPVSIPKITVQTKAGEGDSPGSSPEASKRQHRHAADPGSAINSGKATNGRFLTHPPIRERSATRESGSVDSNGLGSLREGVEPAKQGELVSTTTASVVSLADSHICPSETSEAPRYHDVVQDVFAETQDIDKNLERKNSKTLKQKSKSDPSGEKQRESTALPTFITGASAQAASSPALPEDVDVVSQLPEFRKTDADKRKSKSDDVLTAKESKAAARISKLHEGEKLTSEDSSGEVSATTTPKQPKRSLKKRQRDRAKAAGKQSPLDEKVIKTVTIDATAKHSSPEIKVKEKKRKSGKSATAPSTPQSLSPENTLDKHAKPEQVSLTLPLSKKSSLTRSHSSASVFLHKRSVSTGARPKELHEGHRKIRSSASQDFGTDSDLVAGKRGWTHHFSPSLEPIFSQSTLSLFEGAAEEKVSVNFLMS